MLHVPEFDLGHLRFAGIGSPQVGNRFHVVNAIAPDTFLGGAGW
jgi:hypothetical protein